MRAMTNTCNQRWQQLRPPLQPTQSGRRNIKDLMTLMIFLPGSLFLWIMSSSWSDPVQMLCSVVFDINLHNNDLHRMIWIHIYVLWCMWRCFFTGSPGRSTSLAALFRNQQSRRFRWVRICRGSRDLHYDFMALPSWGAIWGVTPERQKDVWMAGVCAQSDESPLWLTRETSTLSGYVLGASVLLFLFHRRPMAIATILIPQHIFVGVPGASSVALAVIQLCCASTFSGQRRPSVAPRYRRDAPSSALFLQTAHQ